MIKVLFLINTLGGGGAERVLVNLVNNMDKTKFDITVETMFDDGVNASLLDKDIRYISKKAPCPRGIAYIFKLIPAGLLYRYFVGKEHYDIVVAYMHGAPVKVIDGCGDRSVKKAAWLHNGNPETGTFFNFWFSKNKAFSAYQHCDAIVGVCKSAADAFSEYTGITEGVHVVYNTMGVERICELMKGNSKVRYDGGYFNVSSVGRLGNEKGYDRLLNAGKRLVDEGYKIHIGIVGSGALENELKWKISEFKAKEWFELYGFDSNPYSYVANSDLFVCSSRTEGLSTAVSEAVILGVPVVSTDVSGAKEILGENNEYGLVVENSEEGIYEGIKAMLSDKEMYDKYKLKVKERTSFFDTRNTVGQAEKLFEEIIG